MTRFQVIEAKEHHCGQIVRRLRAEHARAIAGFGVHAHREIRTNFDASAFRRAWLIDGRLAALFGVTGALLGVARLWVARPDVGRDPVSGRDREGDAPAIRPDHADKAGNGHGAVAGGQDRAAICDEIGV
jgi:hypothetical protein